MKRIRLPQILSRAPLATACFLLLAAGIVYGGAALIAGAVRRAREPVPPATPKTVLTTPSPAPSAEIPAVQAGVLFVPEPSAEETTAAPTVTPTPPAFTPTPRPTLIPPRTAEAYSAATMDLMLYGFDAGRKLDWCMLAVYRNGACEILSLPKNARAGEDAQPLSTADGVRAASRLATSVLPVRVERYVSIQTEHVGDCVDLLGGVSIDGREMDGAAAEAYLSGGGADELLRIDRRHRLLQALLRRVRTAGWFRLLSMKRSTQEYLESDLSLAETAELYAAFRVADDGDITFCTLPVDSLTVNGARYYTPDVPLVNAWVDARY